MIAIATATIINKYKPPEKQYQLTLQKDGKHFKEVLVGTFPSYYCKVGDEVGLISRCYGIDGFFYIVINRKNEVFMINESSLSQQTQQPPQQYILYQTQEHKFSQFITQSQPPSPPQQENFDIWD